MLMILSADLSLNQSAFAVMSYEAGQIVVHEKVTVNNNRYNAPQRGYKLYDIFTTMLDLLHKYPDITFVVKERGFTRFNLATQTLFRVVGIYELAVHIVNLEREGRTIGIADDISPTTIKRIITGNGKSSKEIVQSALDEYGPFANTDESDAVAVGVTFIKRMVGER